jgi:predicted regulator of Ras-like GTPase activity (Roadblock/LC7/MglB family)
MFGFLKNMLRKSPDAPAESQQTPVPDAASPAEQYVPEPAAAPVRRRAPAAGSAGAAGPAMQRGSKSIEVPLQRILEILPLELQPRVRQPEVGEQSIAVPLEKVLAQLSRGAVRLYFGELRQAAPEVFSTQNDKDRVLVPLPLDEVLARLNPALITRRRAQRQVEVPTDIASPFDLNPDGQLSYFNGPAEAEAEPAAPLAPPRQVTPAKPAAPLRARVNPVQPAAPAAAAAPAPAATPMRVALQSVPTPPPPAAVPFSPRTAPAPAAPQPPPPAPAPALKLGAPAPVNAGSPRPQPAAAPAPAPAGAAAKNGTETLLLSLTAIAENWPDPVRKEIVDGNLVDAKVAVPLNLIERALKQGRIAFSWRILRSWLKPAPPAGNSPQETTALELPLKVVAPLFLARQQERAPRQNKVTVDEDIPNLFFGFPQPEAAAAPPTARPADTNFYVWDDGAEMLRVDETDAKKPPTPGTKFVAKYATPNEVVSRAAALDGVVGALIALPDGLMVANRLPPELNADTLAAFLPQIFGKVSTCTKELRMGELNNLNFTVGNVPWKIFRVNSIFFAAFGRAGEPLPTAQLAALAGELDHKPR